ncbi:unnamed protein product [Blepharisma stoltei]|uniref:CCHC-type domain-containing protein n=1 Tax=Blepharisma stoltei TaxID=1481888 RepID=A0AAU9KS32_9CILI|nr:unnamed protein product [Blepharisma stoltei]
MADIKTRILDLIKEKQMIVKANEEQNQQIKIYEKQIAELNSINEERKSKEKFEERIEELEGECRDLRAECRDLRAECRDLRAECEALQAASAKSDKEIKILQEENRANREKSDKEIKKLSEVIAKLKKEVKRLNESKTDLLEESKSQRTMIKNFRLQDEQNQEKMSKLEEIEFKSWMREIITDLRDDLIKELSGFIDERCYGLSEVDKTANYKGIDMNEVNTCKRNYLLENYGIDTDTFERILEAKYELNYFIHNSTLMEREKVQIYLAGLPDNNELKLIYMSMARFISKREKEELQKQFPNCCRRCGDSGHRTERCQLCYFCGDYGHTQQNCPRRKYNRET